MEPFNWELCRPIAFLSTLTSQFTNASQTVIKVEHVKHSWTVKNFSHCYQEYLEDYVYLHRGIDTLMWSIKIYPSGNGENNKDFVFFCLNRVIGNTACNFGKIGFKSRFILRSSQMKEIEVRIHPSPCHSDYVSFIKRDMLLPQILPSDSFTVNVEIDVAVETITTTVEEMMPSINQEQLANDYLKMLKESVHTDFTIKVGEQEIKTHRAILATRSPVFAAMLNGDTNEAKTGVMVIKDLEYETVSEMLNYIYCGHCVRDMNESSFALGLLIAADKYHLQELKSHCERVLVQSLTFDNVCELLVFSDVYSAPRLKQCAVEFIIQHPRNITSTPGWGNVLRDHQDLVTDIVRCFDN